jgi:hypothetical protein
VNGEWKLLFEIRSLVFNPLPIGVLNQLHGDWRLDAPGESQSG